MTPLRFGIAGFGGFAARWAVPTIAATREAQLQAIQLRGSRNRDPVEGVTNYRSIDALVGDPTIDAIYVTSANESHAADTIAALRAGKHVLVEKPIAVRSTDANEMLGEALRAKRVLRVGHMLRYSRALQHARRLIRSGAIGDIRMATAVFGYNVEGTGRAWTLEPAVAGGGSLIDAGIHAIDAIRFISGQELDAVSAVCLPPPPNVEAKAAVSLQLGRTAIATVVVSSDSDYVTSLLIVGTTGRITIPGFARCREKVSVHIESLDRVETTEHNVADTYSRQLRAFCHAVTAERLSVRPVEDAIENLKVVETAYAASRRAQGGKADGEDE